jgi:hypothetical protein
MNIRRYAVLLSVFAAACGGPSLNDPSDVTITQTAPSETKGSVTVTVRDARMALLPGAQLHLVDGSVTQDAVTDENGEYNFADVPSGAQVSLTVTGPAGSAYNTAILTGVIPDAVGQTQNLPNVLIAKVSDTSESGVPKNNGSLHFDVVLFELDGTFKVKVNGNSVGTLPALASLDSTAVFRLPCTAEESYSMAYSPNLMGCGKLLVQGSFAVDSNADDDVLGVLTFAQAPSTLDLYNWVGGAFSGNSYSVVIVSAVPTDTYSPDAAAFDIADLLDPANALVLTLDLI